MFKFLKKLSDNELKTFKLHFAYSVIEGILAGLLLLNEFVFLKSLKGTSTTLALLFQFSVMLLLFGVLFNQAIKRIKNKKRLLIVTGIVTRLPLVFLLFFPKTEAGIAGNPYIHLIFLGMFFVYFFANNIIFPTINLLLKTNYTHENFGKYYSYATSAKKVMEIVGTFGFGLWLDLDKFAFTYAYPAMAFLGMFSIYLLASIPFDSSKIALPTKGFLALMLESVSNMFGTLRKNKPYQQFEMSFMFYGFAFMATYAIINIYFDKVLGLSFSGLAFYKNLYNVVAIILLPIVGRLIGSIDVRKFGIFTFSSMLSYLVFIALSEYFPQYTTIYGIKMYWTLIIAFVLFGVFTATMALLWSIGSAYYCSPNEAADYQAIHLTLTGVRASFAPLFGVYLFESMSYTAVFGLGIVLLIGAMLTIRYAAKSEQMH